MNNRKPTRTAARLTRSMFLMTMAIAMAAIIGALRYQPLMASSTPATHAGRAQSIPAAPATVLHQAGGLWQHRPPRDPPPIVIPPAGQHRAPGAADGAVPDGVTVFDNAYPGIAYLDPDLLQALRNAAIDAAAEGVTFSVSSGWRSPEYQLLLLREAVAKYGSVEEAARWVATAETSAHVSGDAVDLASVDALAWLSAYGAGHGLCQIYRNEPWHFELRPDAIDHGCPPMYADPTHDPRMQP